MSNSGAGTQELIIGIPTFNADRSLAELVEKILPIGHPIVVCDDGSEIPVCRSLLSFERKVTIIRHNTNRGKAAALRTLFRYATDTNAKALLVMDADGQHPADFVHHFISEHEKLPRSMIIGSRLAQARKIPLIRRLGIRSADFLITLITGKKIRDSQCGMRLIPAGLLPHLLADTTQGFVAESNAIIIAIKNGYGLCHVDIPAIYGAPRSSHYRAVRDSLQIALHLSLHLLKLKKV